MRISNIVKFVLPLLALAAVPAFALPVTYSVSGSTFTCVNPAVCTGNGTNSVTFNPSGNTFTFSAPGDPYSVDADSTGSFGLITYTGTATPVTLTNLQLNLLITQTVPAPGGAQALAGMIAGTFAQNKVIGSLTFNPINSVTIQGVTYTLTPFTFLVPTSTQSGNVTLQGLITAVPEPGFYLLSTAGLIGVLTVVRRRRQTA